MNVTFICHHTLQVRLHHRRQQQHPVGLCDCQWPPCKRDESKLATLTLLASWRDDVSLAANAILLVWHSILLLEAGCDEQKDTVIRWLCPVMHAMTLSSADCWR